VTPRLTPKRARLLVWVAFAVLYVVLGSFAPFILLLGWWEAVPAVALALVTGDRAERWAQERAAARDLTPNGV
jgi:hypothetical protein